MPVNVVIAGSSRALPAFDTITERFQNSIRLQKNVDALNRRPVNAQEAILPYSIN